MKNIPTRRRFCAAVSAAALLPRWGVAGPRPRATLDAGRAWRRGQLSG
ncbi:hypothetical protein [Achromobacter xylosoxidans]|nr:hypothetical protein [Achromobacter xylosoxidans]